MCGYPLTSSGASSVVDVKGSSDQAAQKHVCLPEAPRAEVRG